MSSLGVIAARAKSLSMAEACASRTHLRQANLPNAGFEDREDHRTPCASVLWSSRARGLKASPDYSEGSDRRKVLHRCRYMTDYSTDDRKETHLRLPMWKSRYEVAG